MDAIFENILLIVIIIGWLIAVAGLIWWLIRRYAPQFKSLTSTSLAAPTARGGNQPAVLLTIEVPKENDKTPLAAETIFSSLHGIGDQNLSFEIEAKEKSIRFYVWVPLKLRSYVESQIYAQYPDINIFEIQDYANKIPPDLSVVATELVFKKKDFFPIKTFQDFTVDPLAAITGTISKLGEKEHIWIQMLIKPESDKWRDKALAFITAVKEGRTLALGKTITKGLISFTGDIVKTAIQGGGESAVKPVTKTELSPGTELVLKAIEEKSSKLGFRAKIRLVVWDQNEASAHSRLQLTIGAFKQFNTNNLNSFEIGSVSTDRTGILQQYTNRTFGPGGLIMNVTELASIYHLPNLTVTTPNIVWAGSRKGEPPANLPLMAEVPAEELTVLAQTNFRGSDEKFGIKLKDRARHVYVIGKSGTGKSTLLENMTIDDIRERRGVAVIDPHGDFVDTVLSFVPNYRANEVIVFDPGDRDFPIAVNMFEVADPKYKVVVASGVVGIFKKIFGYSWGPRLEYWLSSAVLALLDYPEATLILVPRMFTDKSFREKVLLKVQDPLIKDRWISEYSKLDQKQQAETISPILNKVGQFLSSPIIRNIVGQPKSSIDFRALMDEGRVLLVKLAKGIIGEDSAALLGAMIITQIQLAAMSRADMPESERRDFYLYVDEFQNFATESFQAILSEARKYHLSLTLANQYLGQLTPEISSAIFGNVNTAITFRVGGEDASFLEKEFAPVFDANDLVNLHMFNIYLKLSIDGLTTGAFSAQTLPLPLDRNNIQNKIIDLSRERYAKPASFVEDKITADFEQALAQNLSISKGKFIPKSFAGPRKYDDRQLPDRPVPFRPGLKMQSPTTPPALEKPNVIPSAPSAPSAIQPKPQPAIERAKPSESLLKKVISSIESKKPWVPPPDKPPKNPNLISELGEDTSAVDDIRRQRANEAEKKSGDQAADNE